VGVGCDDAIVKEDINKKLEGGRRRLLIGINKKFQAGGCGCGC